METLADPQLISNGYVMEISSPSLFNDVIVSDTMFSDHMPNRYEATLMWCSKVLAALPTQPPTTVSLHVGEARPQA